MKKTRIGIIFFLLPVLFGYTDKNPVLKIEGGKIQGVETGKSGILLFKGIPYAAPPVGDLRWKEPQKVIPWKGIRVCDTFGAAAPQKLTDRGSFYDKEFYAQSPHVKSEDCLYLNVWTPSAGNKKAKLPVAMWIHGGAYRNGFGHENEFDGVAWAEKGVILVTINYRLGILGFLAHPELTAENPIQRITLSSCYLKLMKKSIHPIWANQLVHLPTQITVIQDNESIHLPREECRA